MRLLSFLLFISVTAFGQSGEADKKENTGEGTFTEGMMLFVLEDFSGALKQFETFVKLDEKSAVGYFMRSRAENALNQTLQAEQSAETAVNLDRSSFYYLKNLAEIQVKNNRNKQAQESYRNLIKLKTDYSDAYFALLTLQVNAGESSDALKTLELAEKQFGASEKITQAKQTILLRDNKVDAALKEGNKRMAQDPQFSLNQAKILLESKRTKDAVKLLEETVARNPDFVEGFGMLSELYALQTDAAASDKLLEQIVENKSFPYSLKVNAIGNHLHAFGSSRPVAESLLEKTNLLITEHPDQARAYLFAGDINFRLNKPLAARDAYSKAINLDKNQFEVWLALAQVSYHLGDFSRLEKVAENATMYFPSHTGLWFFLGLAQVKNGQLDDAEISWEEAAAFSAGSDFIASVEAAKALYFKQGSAEKIKQLAKSKPENEFLQYFLSESLLEKEANQAVQTAAALSEKFSQVNLYKILLAKALLNAKKTQQAQETLAFIKPEEAAVSFEYFEVKGDIFSASGNMEEAKVQWSKALEINKSSKKVQDKLKQL